MNKTTTNNTYRFYQFNNSIIPSKNYQSMTFNNTISKSNITSQPKIDPMNNNEYLDKLEPFLSIDLLSEIKKNNLEKVYNLLPLILDEKIEPSSNYSLSFLVSIMQNLLKFLFESKANIEAENESISKFTENLTEIDSKITRNKNIIDKQEKLILNLHHKYKTYQTVINASGNFLNKKKHLYFCDVCPYKKFNDYESLHNHYTNCHIDPDAIRNDTTYVSFNQAYFDQQIEEMKRELDELIININQSKSKKFEQQYDDLKFSLDRTFANKNKLSSQPPKFSPLKEYHNNLNTSQRTDKDNKEIINKIKQFQINQQEKYEKLVKQFNEFKQQIINSIQEVSSKQ